MATKPAKREITRSRTGCWTCRARRKKCDETRPVCRTCAGLDLACEGYGVRLKWTVHRKARVTFNTPRSAAVRAVKPSKKSSAQSPGCYDFSLSPSPSPSPEEKAAHEELLRQHLNAATVDSLSLLEREVLYDFADWGAATLGSILNTGPEYFAENLAGCDESKSMLLNCLTYQITLDPKYAQYADEYYCRSLEEFRHELSVTNGLDNDSTACAGLLLCSISMNRAMPWTVHLNGIVGLLRERGAFGGKQFDEHDTMSLIGILDLPTHILGRQNEQLHVWNSYCQFQPGVEEISGLPCSLIDILSAIMQPGVEERLLQWKPDTNDVTMYKIWDTARYAGIISARDFGPCYETATAEDSPPPMTLLYESAVHYVLLGLRELDAAMKDKNLAGRRALFFPLVAAASASAFLTSYDKAFIVQSINALADGDGDLYHAHMIHTLTAYWATDGRRSLQQFTLDEGLELGLF